MLYPHQICQMFSWCSSMEFLPVAAASCRPAWPAWQEQLCSSCSIYNTKEKNVLTTQKTYLWMTNHRFDSRYQTRWPAFPLDMFNCICLNSLDTDNQLKVKLQMLHLASTASIMLTSAKLAKHSILTWELSLNVKVVLKINDNVKFTIMS